jgi:hypothetical protein
VVGTKMESGQPAYLSLPHSRSQTGLHSTACPKYGATGQNQGIGACHKNVATARLHTCNLKKLNMRFKYIKISIYLKN